jgi:ribosome-associated translation inhibitor RaiA
MKIQVNTDANIQGREALVARVEQTVSHALDRYKSQLTRVEVHLGDENGARKSRDDKRCVMEARLEGRQPVAATDHADTLEQAIRGAADKLVRLLGNQLGKASSGQRVSIRAASAEPDALTD